MNKSYRSIWNESLGAWVATSEITSARGKRSTRARASLPALLLASAITAGVTLGAADAQAQTVCGTTYLSANGEGLTGGVPNAQVGVTPQGQAISCDDAINFTGTGSTKVTRDGYTVTIDSGLHFFSVNNTDSTAGNYNNDGATGANALAVGVGLWQQAPMLLRWVRAPAPAPALDAQLQSAILPMSQMTTALLLAINQ